MTTHPFKSERLVYRALEDNPEDDTFLHSVQLDAIGYGNSNIRMLKPLSKKNTVEGLKKFVSEDALLGVVICIQPDANQTDSTTSESVPTPIGYMTLSNRPPHVAHHRTSFIAIEILPQYQGKGYGSEALNWLVNWGFQIAGLHRIVIGCFAYNTGACKLYPRLGFVYEGKERESVWFNGEWHDSLSFSMLEHEWREKHLLSSKST